MQAVNLISSAFRLIGVLASGETASGAEAVDALSTLNDMIDEWQNESLMIFTRTRNVFSLVSGTQTYTLGPGGTFSLDPRPVRIDNATIINLSNPAMPLELPLQLYTTDQWAGVPVKNIQSALPLAVYDDEGFPLRNLSYYPIPNTTVQSALYTWTALSRFADLVTDYTFPPGYAKAIRFNLALDLAPEYGRPIPADVAVQALSSKGRIKAINAPLVDLAVDAALLGPPGNRVYNWLSDTYGRGSR